MRTCYGSDLGGDQLGWLVVAAIVAVGWAWNEGHLEWLPSWVQVILAFAGLLLLVVLARSLGGGDDCVPTNTNLC